MTTARCARCDGLVGEHSPGCAYRMQEIRRLEATTFGLILLIFCAVGLAVLLEG